MEHRLKCWNMCVYRDGSNYNVQSLQSIHRYIQIQWLDLLVHFFHTLNIFFLLFTTIESFFSLYQHWSLLPVNDSIFFSCISISSLAAAHLSEVLSVNIFDSTAEYECVFLSPNYFYFYFYIDDWRKMYKMINQQEFGHCGVAPCRRLIFWSFLCCISLASNLECDENICSRAESPLFVAIHTNRENVGVHVYRWEIVCICVYVIHGLNIYLAFNKLLMVANFSRGGNKKIETFPWNEQRNSDACLDVESYITWKRYCIQMLARKLAVKIDIFAVFITVLKLFMLANRYWFTYDKKKKTT